jgi:hypothetical protein
MDRETGTDNGGRYRDQASVIRKELKLRAENPAREAEGQRKRARAEIEMLEHRMERHEDDYQARAGFVKPEDNRQHTRDKARYAVVQKQEAALTKEIAEIKKRPKVTAADYPYGKSAFTVPLKRYTVPKVGEGSEAPEALAYEELVDLLEKAGGWGPIPGGTRGGQRKRVGMKWAYRYPDGRGGFGGIAKKKPKRPTAKKERASVQEGFDFDAEPETGEEVIAPEESAVAQIVQLAASFLKIGDIIRPFGDHRFRVTRVTKDGFKVRIETVNTADGRSRPLHVSATDKLWVEQGQADETPAMPEEPAESTPEESTQPDLPKPPRKRAPKGTPRGDATATTKEMIDEGAFVNDRKSGVEQRGEDVLRSARHRALEWKGLRASLEGEDAKRIFTRNFLSREKPIDFMGRTQGSPAEAASQLMTFLCHKKIPTKPPEEKNGAMYWFLRGSGTVSQETYAMRLDGVERRRLRDEWKAMSEDEQREVAKRYEASAREQYYNAFNTINEIMEKHSANPSLDPDAQFRNIYSDIRAALQKPDSNKNAVERETLRKTYNAIVGRGKSSPRRQANSIAQKAFKLNPNDADARAKDFTETTLKVMETGSVDKALGIDKAARRKFDISQFYNTDVMHRKGPPSRYESIQQGLDLLDKDSGKGVFDMRGVQWGKSVTDDERKHHLKSLIDSWDDLAFVTGLPTQMASYNGKLAIAVGARGRAGALAHYEPSMNVINLTRNGGAGALAHEWGHFFDYEVARAEKRAGQAETDTPLTERGGWRSYTQREPGPQGATADAVKALRDSDAWKAFRKRLPRACSLNGVSDKKMEYWTSSVEMFARCFERHVQHKLTGAGRVNTYLSGLSNGNSGEDNLWPNDDETAAMAPLFDKVFEAFKESGLLEKMMRWAEADRLRKAVAFTVPKKRFVVGDIR